VKITDSNLRRVCIHVCVCIMYVYMCMCCASTYIEKIVDTAFGRMFIIYMCMCCASTYVEKIVGTAFGRALIRAWNMCECVYVTVYVSLKHVCMRICKRAGVLETCANAHMYLCMCHCTCTELTKITFCLYTCMHTCMHECACMSLCVCVGVYYIRAQAQIHTCVYIRM
jgi:hypothetical protein